MFTGHATVCSYTPSLSRKVTHLVVASKLAKGSEKLETARKKTALGTWNVAIVSLSWIQLCVKSAKLHPTAEHAIHVEVPPPGPPSGLAGGARSKKMSQPADSNTVAVTSACSTEPASCLQSEPYDELNPQRCRAQAASSARVSMNHVAQRPNTGGSFESLIVPVSTPALPFFHRE